MKIPPFEELSSSLSDLGVEDRVVSEVEPPKAGKSRIQKANSKVQNYNSKCKIDIKKRAYSYALELIKLVGQLNQGDLSVQVIARQLLRSGTSVGANIMEAQASSSKREFTNFLNHSLKSANETKFGWHY